MKKRILVGFDLKRIAQDMRISYPTIIRDKKAIGEEIRKEVSEDMNGYIANFKAQQEMLMQTLIHDFMEERDKTSEERRISKLLNLAHEISTLQINLFDKLQSVGWLTKAPTEVHNINEVSVSDMVQEILSDFRDDNFIKKGKGNGGSK